MNDQESSSVRPESSSSGEGQPSSGSNGGSNDTYEQPENNNGGNQQRVPQYVDMVIPDYDETNNKGKGSVSNRPPSRGDPSSQHPQANHALTTQNVARLPSHDRPSNGESHPHPHSHSHSHSHQHPHPLPLPHQHSHTHQRPHHDDSDEEAQDDRDEGELAEDDSLLEEESLDAYLDDDASPQQPCIPGENDVLLTATASDEEGGEHQGNLKYRAVVRHLAKKYTKVKIGYRKAAVQILFNAVKSQGGRFLKRTQEGLWKEVSNKKAYRKSSHAIRGTCRKVEIVTSSRKRSNNNSNNKNSSKKRHRPTKKQQQQQAERQSSNSESSEMTTSSSGGPAIAERKSNLEILALRLQTKDTSLKHLSLDLLTVNHDYIFPFAKALDSTDLLTSFDLRLSHMNRTNANALAWGLKRCRGLKQVKLSYDKLGEKSAIVLAGILDNSSIVSLNLDGNNIQADSLKIIARMMSQSKGCKLQRLSLECNPLGDEGAGIVAKMINSSRHLTFLNLGENGFQAAGASLIRAAINKKTTCLFEVSGLQAMESRKRAIGESTEESNEEQANKKPRANPSANAANDAGNTNPQAISSSQPSSSFGSMRQSSSNASSSNDTEMAPNSTGSDNGINNGTGSDDAPTSSMNDSDGAPDTASD